MPTINPDKPAQALAQFILAEAEADRAREVEMRADVEKQTPGATANWPKLPPLPTLEQIIEQSVRIGLRALGRGALHSHQHHDREANPGANHGHHVHGCGLEGHSQIEHAYCPPGPSPLAAY
jgi:hypothetical protein